ncbi:MAG: c-type cytochrome [Pirellulaceae bacterium]
MATKGRWTMVGLAVVIPLSVLAATTFVMSIPPDTQGIDVVAGRESFRAHCGSCHFAKEGFPAHHGPNLFEIGKTGATRRPQQSAEAYILESILEPGVFVSPSGRPGMPPNVAADLAPDEIRNIVGFLAAQGAFPDYREIRTLPIPDRRTKQMTPTVVRRDDMEMAERILREKGACLQCHSFYSTPDELVNAPGLFAVGLVDPQAIELSILEPNREIKTPYQTVVVQLPDGRALTGQLLSQSGHLVTLCTRDAENRLSIRQIDTGDPSVEAEQAVIHPSPASLMPTGFDKTLTRKEIDALITLILQLN